jgi:hypothetical protein
VRAALLALALVLVVGCKVDKPDKQAAPSAPRASGSGSPAQPVEALQPELPGAKQLQVRTKSDTQLTAIWCMDTAEGRDAVVKVADTLRADGWTDVSTRGAADRFGVAANKGDVRFSGTIGGRDQACTGTLVITTLARLAAPIKIPPTTEPIR